MSTISRSPLNLPSLPVPILKFRTPHTKTPTLILFRTLNFQTHLRQPPPEPIPTEPEGTGSGAPTPGELSLRCRQSLTSSKAAFAANNNGKKKKEKKSKGLFKVSPPVASCYGCGAALQTLEIDAPGYVDPDTYKLKKKHHQLRTVICGRCQLLSHGHMITAVGGHGGYSGGKPFVTAEELREKLSHLRYKKALIVKLVDVVDFNGSFLAHVRDLVGANPIILVVTKIDLLPKGTDLDCVGDWVVEVSMKKKLNVLSVHLTSSKSLVGINGVISKIQMEKKGRDVYILGCANVGKSAFINALLEKMGEKDPFAAAAQRYRPIQSAVPGTTLGPIQIDAFPGGGRLYDTPGIHLHHRLAAAVHSEDLPALAPQSRLRGQPFPNSQATSDTGLAENIQRNGLNGFSIFWGGLVRVDVLKVLPQTRVTFYGPKSLKLHLLPTDQADEFYRKEVGALLTPPSRKDQVGWRGLDLQLQLQLKFDDYQRPASDVAISGLGWISFEPICKAQRTSEETLEGVVKELQLIVHVPKPIEIFVRPPLPVGNVGAEWYQYRELTEREQDLRPKWHF